MLNPSACEFVPGMAQTKATNQRGLQVPFSGLTLDGKPVPAIKTSIQKACGKLPVSQQKDGPPAQTHMSPGASFEMDESEMFDCSSALTSSDSLEDSPGLPRRRSSGTPLAPTAKEASPTFEDASSRSTSEASRYGGVSQATTATAQPCSVSTAVAAPHTHTGRTGASCSACRSAGLQGTHVSAISTAAAAGTAPTPVAPPPSCFATAAAVGATAVAAAALTIAPGSSLLRSQLAASLAQGGCSTDGGAVSNGAGNDGVNDGVCRCCGQSLVVPVGTIVSEVAAGKPTLSRVGPQDFDVLRIVGQGAFGKVFQVRYKVDGCVYAMKVMCKDRIVQLDHHEYVRSERDVLTAVTHPYIVAMRFSFQTPTKLYLVLDFVNGGHLFFNLYKQGVFSEDVSRLYTAEIVCAISYLHASGIVHRDLKPENVLLDHEGHVKVTDFGLAKGNLHGEEDRTNSFIGTLEYMAPEIIQGRGHGKAVDWWSTGILLYEMLCGMPPFRAKSRQALQTQILSTKLKFPKFISNDAQSLLKGLLQRETSKRLGAGPDGSEVIKRHPFFKPINWAKLEQRQIESKFKPQVANPLDVANFDKIWTEQKPPELSPVGTPTSGAHDRHADLFHGYTYVSPAFLIEAVEAMKPRMATHSAPATG